MVLSAFVVAAYLGAGGGSSGSGRGAGAPRPDRRASCEVSGRLLALQPAWSGRRLGDARAHRVRGLVAAWPDHRDAQWSVAEGRQVKLRFRRDSATRKNSYAEALSKRANPCLAATTHLMLSRRSMQSAPEKAHSGRAGVGWDARCLVAAHAERGPPLRATPLSSEEPVVPPPGCSGRDQSGQLSGWLKRLFVPSFSARPMKASAPVMPFGSFFFSAFASAF